MRPMAYPFPKNWAEWIRFARYLPTGGRCRRKARHIVAALCVALWCCANVQPLLARRLASSAVRFHRIAH